jgi:uncharacterized Zn-finger protein
MSKNNYKLHLRTHSDERPYPCLFPGCEARFKVKHHLLDHINSKHKDIRNHVCKFCGKQFHRPSTLKEHENTHTNARPHC